MKFLTIITAMCVTMTVALPLGEKGAGGKSIESTPLVIKSSKVVVAKANEDATKPGRQPIIQSGVQAYTKARTEKQSIGQALGKGFAASRDAYQVNQYLGMHTKADNLEANAHKAPNEAARNKILAQAKDLHSQGDRYGFKVTQGNPNIQPKLLNAYTKSGGTAPLRADRPPVANSPPAGPSV